jgi:hypothetical protein
VLGAFDVEARGLRRPPMTAAGLIRILEGHAPVVFAVDREAQRRAEIPAGEPPQVGEGRDSSTRPWYLPHGMRVIGGRSGSG